MSDPPLLAGRIALVTGASRGIGYALALGLAEAGAHVIATARTQAGLEELDDAVLAATGAHATLVPLDITDGDGLDRLGAALYERFGRLDILVSNAGDLGLLTPLAHLDPKVWDRALTVNATATFRVIRAMDPLLRQAQAARAIFLTSGAATAPRAFWGAYAATKAAMESLVQVYADEVDTTAIRCTLLSPGPLRTRMRMQAFPGEDPADLTRPEALVPLLLDLVKPEGDPPLRASFPAWRKGRDEPGAIHACALET
ncbi:SDR family NAD(P)-dependent oxidoreductase [Caulobacter sp. S45]|uniref:SDR family NAD(P)-dependent oxidoreductase n=1 Tax=Caulobacter sp. S45 TaxID=1641861 RepID=UPI00157620C9|nr:SDR family NAD(P)-dependent oxidoreductase [Caulobacter sp. S45]